MRHSFLGIDVVLTTTAANHIEDGTNREDDANNPADPKMSASVGKRRTEDVEQRLDPERVDEGAVFHDVFLLDQDAKEKECEESVVACHDDAVDAQGAFVTRDACDREQNGQHAESNGYTVTETV